MSENKRKDAVLYDTHSYAPALLCCPNNMLHNVIDIYSIGSDLVVSIDVEDLKQMIKALKTDEPNVE